MGDGFELLEELEARDEGLATKAFPGDRLLQRPPSLGEINRAEPLPVLFHQPRRKRKRGRGGETSDRAGLLQVPPMRLDFLPVLVQLLFVRRAHDAEDRFPTDRHLRHDDSESVAGLARLRFHRTGACVKDQGELREESEREKNEQNREREPKDERGAAQRSADISPNEREYPVVPRRA